MNGHASSRARRLLVAVVALCAFTTAAPAVAANRPVPSLQPAKTAKLWQRLVERPREHGLRTATGCRPLRAVFYTASDWTRLATKLEADGWQLHFHTIGDRAVRVALDAIEAARRDNGPRDARHTLAHLELVDPADVPRFAALGAVASFSPQWAQRDAYSIDTLEPYLGSERHEREAENCVHR